MDFPFSKPLEQYTNDELISLFAILKQKLDAILSEGKKREILYFLTANDQLELLRNIFGSEVDFVKEV